MTQWKRENEQISKRYKGKRQEKNGGHGLMNTEAEKKKFKGKWGNGQNSKGTIGQRDLRKR